MAKYKYIIILLLLVGLFTIVGCPSGNNNQQYQIINVQPENRYIDAGQNSRIFFEIVNNAETTLVSRIETQLNSTCFGTTEDKGLDGIPPKQKISYYVYIRSSSSYYNGEGCKGKSFKAVLVLKDIGGQKLASEETEISIPK